MAISDELFGIALAIAFNNIIILRYNKFFAGIANIVIGLTALYFGYTAGASYNYIMGTLGYILLFGGLGMLIYELLNLKSKG